MRPGGPKAETSASGGHKRDERGEEGRSGKRPPFFFCSGEGAGRGRPAPSPRDCGVRRLAARVQVTEQPVGRGATISSCPFACTYSGLGGSSSTFLAFVSVTDAGGNTVSGLGTALTVTITRTGGTFTGGSATTETVTIPASGAAQSNSGGNVSGSPGEISFKTDSGNWSSDSLNSSASGYSGAQPRLGVVLEELKAANYPQVRRVLAEAGYPNVNANPVTPGENRNPSRCVSSPESPTSQ